MTVKKTLYASVQKPYMFGLMFNIDCSKLASCNKVHSGGRLNQGHVGRAGEAFCHGTQNLIS